MSGNGYGSRAGVTHFDHRVLAFGKVQHLRQVGPRLRRGRRRTGLQDSQMVDGEARIGVAIAINAASCPVGTYVS